MEVLEKVKKEIENTQVIIPAGGKAKRMGAIDKPKALLELGDKTLLDLCLELCINCGFKNFVFLLGYKYEDIEKHLRNKGYFEKLNIKIALDPFDGCGRGPALRNAIDTKKIDVTKRAFVLYPDDLILDTQFPLRFLLHHLHCIENNGVIVTVALVSGSQYPFGVADVDANGIVTHFQEKPFIERYTNTAIYFWEPEVFKHILSLIPKDSKVSVEFEEGILPILANERKVAAMIAQPGIWLPVNTYKEYEKAEKILKEKGWI